MDVSLTGANTNETHMKKIHFYFLLGFFACSTTAIYGQIDSLFLFEPSVENPFGLPNPDAPKQIKDFAPLIGECACISIARGADQTWEEPVPLVWRFKYVMNGKAIQDESLKADGKHSGSIRQFNADSAKWYIHYYSTSGVPPTLPSWEGSKKEDGNIVLYRDNLSPSGKPGFYRITFYNISEKGFDWVGEWVDRAETIQYPLWKIRCKKKGS